MAMSLHAGLPVLCEARHGAVIARSDSDAVIARSEATKQSSFAVLEKKLDCFASLAMTRSFRRKRGLAVIARSEATKQSSLAASKEKLDCFAALAMTGVAAVGPGTGGAMTTVRLTPTCSARRIAS
jgi:hypothetical protein